VRGRARRVTSATVSSTVDGYVGAVISTSKRMAVFGKHVLVVKPGHNRQGHWALRRDENARRKSESEARAGG